MLHNGPKWKSSVYFVLLILTPYDCQKQNFTEEVKNIWQISFLMNSIVKKYKEYKSKKQILQESGFKIFIHDA